jgi:hypothetical protein
MDPKKTTIRAYLRSQRRRMTQAHWIGFGVLFAVAFVFHGAPHREVRIYGTVVAIIAIIVTSFLITLRRLKCPFCGQSLSKNSQVILFGAGLTNCPHCGADYSQPMPRTPFR